MNLQATLSETQSLSVELQSGSVLCASMSEIITNPPYEGVYMAIPSSVSQLFETRGLRMVDDFEVTAIPYFEVSNPAGGKTATIGN